MQSLGMNAPGGLHLVYASRFVPVNLVAELVLRSVNVYSHELGM